MKQRGFTLIEILVVITIIGILSSVVLVGLNTARKQGRDTRRVADLRQVQNGLELYFQKNGTYPTGISSWSGLQSALTGAGIGITKISDDPLSSQHYSYGVTSAGDTYLLGARLEDPGSASLRDDIDGTPTGYSPSIDCNDPVYCIQF